MKIEVDHDLCIGFGNCVKFAPGVFRLDDDELAVVDDVTAASVDEIRTAERLCPAAAITVESDDG